MDNAKKIRQLNQAVEQVKQKQTDDLVIDFDQAVEEYKNQNQPIQIHFKGEVFEICRELPMGVHIFKFRHVENGRLEDAQALELMEKLLGERFIDLMESCFEAPLSVSGKLFSRINEQWGITGAKYVNEDTKKK